MKKENELDKIELRSDEVQEILSRPPRWIIRWGVTIIFVVVAIIVVGSWFFKYPDIIPAKIRLTTKNPPAPVLAKATGKIQNLAVVDNEPVEENQIIGVIENPANLESVNKVLQYLGSFKEEFNLGELVRRPEKVLELGNIQPAYANFSKYIDDYNRTIKLGYHQKKIALYKLELEKYKLYLQNLNVQKGILNEEYMLAKKQFLRDSTIYFSKDDFMSDSEFEKSKSGLLSKAYNYEQIKVSIANVEIQIESLHQSIVELQLQEEKQLAGLNLSIWEAYENLHSAIDSWEYQYVLKAPTKGLVTFNQFWNENQTVKAGENVVTIIPENEGEIIGKVQLTFTGAGKVKIGQQVNIRFAGYPYLEFGMVRGKVRSISMAPDNDSYTAEISLPDGLKTFYGVELEFKQEMQGTAEIITENIRLMERIIRPLRYILKKNTTIGDKTT